MKKRRCGKRFHAVALLALAALLLCGSFSGSAETQTDQIYRFIQEQLGYTREELTLNQTTETEEGGLAFSLKLKEADPTTNGLIIGELDAQGNCIRLEGPQSIDLRTQYLNDWFASHFHYDTLYELVQRWRPIVDAMSPEELAALSKAWGQQAGRRYPLKTQLRYEEQSHPVQERDGAFLI